MLYIHPQEQIELDKLSITFSKQWEEYFKHDFLWMKEECLPYHRKLQKKLYFVRKEIEAKKFSEILIKKWNEDFPLFKAKLIEHGK